MLELKSQDFRENSAAARGKSENIKNKSIKFFIKFLASSGGDIKV